jgi:hypothetical protein
LKAIKNGLIEISEQIEAGRFRFDKPMKTSTWPSRRP